MASVPAAPSTCDTRSEHRVLMPVSDSFVNSSELHPSTSKKRRRSWAADLGKPFSITPQPSSSFDQPQILSPLLILPRSSIPLCQLEPIIASTAQPSVRHFTSHVEALEALEKEYGHSLATMVLLSRLDADQSLYVVERVSRGIYALCKLNPSANLRALKAAASSTSVLDNVAKREFSGVDQGGDAWWKAAVSERGLPEADGQSKRRRLDTLNHARVSMKRPGNSHFYGALSELPAGGILPSHPRSEPALPAAPATLDLPPEACPAVLVEIAEPDPCQAMEMVRIQYLEALYISKTSLAYFAKGPLSRARAAVSGDKTTPDASGQLISFLQDSVHPLALSDKKYRETIPGMVQGPPGAGGTDDEDVEPSAAVKHTKRRRSQKTKPGKDGLFATEHEYIARWWRMEDADLDAAPSIDDFTKSKIAKLRARETELQMIVILEILALQSSSQPLLSGSGQAKETSDLSKQHSADGKLSAKKKSLDLGLVLDLLLDRLCIWQSVANEEDLVSSSSAPSADQGSNITGPKAGMVQRELNRPSRSGASTANSLRDFCVEVVIPFYATRLPDRCAAISRKLGGPSVSKPAHLIRDPALNGVQQPQSHLRSRQKAKTKTVVPTKARRALERVMTEGKATHGPQKQFAPPNLTRSVTAPAVPGLKREASETPLSSLPSMVANRSGILQSKRFQQREVDLGAAASKVDVRSKRKASFATELDKAIAVLKKPNRGLAVKEIAETSDRRVLGLHGNGRGTKKGSAAGPARSVQVMATPKGNRKKDMDTAQSAGQHDSLQLSEQGGTLDLLPPSGDPRIMSSSTRPSHPPSLPGGQLQITSPTLSRRTGGNKVAIESTPSRGSAHNVISFVNSAQKKTTARSGLPPSTPPLRRVLAPGLLTVPVSLPKTYGDVSPDGPHNRLPETPCRQKKAHSISPDRGLVGATGHIMATSSFASSRVLDPGRYALPASKSQDAGVEASIYESLGWDDEDELA